MAEATSNPVPVASNPVPVEGEEQFIEESFSERFMDWVRTELVWYAGSFTVHLLLLSMLLLFGFSARENLGDAPVFQSNAPDTDKKEPEKFDKFDMGQIDETPPPQLDVDPTLEKPKTEAHEEEYYDESKVFEHRGGGSKTGAADAASAGASVLAFGDGPKMTAALRASEWASVRGRTTARAAPATASADAAAATAQSSLPAAAAPNRPNAP